MILKEGIAHALLECEGFFCRHCGAREKVFPISISPKRLQAMTLAGEAFAEEHAGCELGDTSPARRAGESPEAWLNSGDTGISSKTIWSVMTGRPFPDRHFLPSVPLDPSDFGRCHRLLERFPEWRARLGEVAERYPEWAPLVDAWDRMTALHQRDEPTGESAELYALMRDLRGVGR